MTCIRCGSEATRKDGQTRLGGHCWRCHRWRRRFTARSMRAFTRHGFPDDVIDLAISWYVRSRRSTADVGAWFTERGLVIHRRLDLALDPTLSPIVRGGGAGVPTTRRHEMAR